MDHSTIKKVIGNIYIGMIIFMVLCINAFPPDGGISQTYSPRTIIISFTLDYSKHCTVKFGTYVETYYDTPPTHTMSERSQGYIYLGITTNFQGRCKFFSLRIGWRITRNKFTPLPMPQSVIINWKACPPRKIMMKILSSLTAMGSLKKYTTIISINMTSPQEWITTIIITIVTTYPMKTEPIMKKKSQPMKMMK